MNVFYLQDILLVHVDKQMLKNHPNFHESKNKQITYTYLKKGLLVTIVKLLISSNLAS